MNAVDAIAGIVSEAALDAINRVNLGELNSLGAVEDFISSAVGQFLKQYGPQVAQQLAAIAEPAARKAAEVIGPVVEEKLKAQIPTLALVMGAVLGVAYLMGGALSRREVRKARRAA